MLSELFRREALGRTAKDLPPDTLGLCRIAAVVLIAMATSVASAAQPEWLRSLEEGQKAAQASEKNVLIVFTGHGWCVQCEILDREVFQQAEFVDATRGEFIFIEYGTPAASAESHGVKGPVKSDNLEDILYAKVADELAHWGRSETGR